MSKKDTRRWAKQLWSQPPVWEREPDASFGPYLIATDEGHHTAEAGSEADEWPRNEELVEKLRGLGLLPERR